MTKPQSPALTSVHGKPVLIPANFSLATASPAVKHGSDFRASTEPTAQYEDPGTVKVASKVIGPDGGEIALRKTEGDDVNRDGRKDHRVPIYPFSSNS